jgi:transcriptional regulator with XRE-family HTH domain
MTGNQLRQIINSMELTQRQFAARVGYTEEHLSRLVKRGEQELPPGADARVKLALMREAS